MHFVGCNLLLSDWVYIKTILQATSYEKTSTVSLCFPAAPGRRPSRGAQKVEGAQGDSSQIGEGSLVGSWRIQGSQAWAPYYRQLWGGPRTRGGGPAERKHIFCWRVYCHHPSSLIAPLRVEGLDSTFFFSIAVLPSPISQENFIYAWESVWWSWKGRVPCPSQSLQILSCYTNALINSVY